MISDIVCDYYYYYYWGLGSPMGFFYFIFGYCSKHYIFKTYFLRVDCPFNWRIYKHYIYTCSFQWQHKMFSLLVYAYTDDSIKLSINGNLSVISDKRLAAESENYLICIVYLKFVWSVYCHSIYIIKILRWWEKVVSRVIFHVWSDPEIDISCLGVELSHVISQWYPLLWNASSSHHANSLICSLKSDENTRYQVVSLCPMGASVV